MIEFDIWTHVPDFTTNPKEARVGRPDIIAISNAPEFISFPESRVERILVFGFAWDVVRDWTLAKQFWSEKGGRAEVFLLPSWQRDLTPVAMPTAGAYEITVNHADYAAAFLSTTRRDEVGRYIFAYDSTNGLQVLKALSAAVVTGGSTITTEQAFAFTPEREAIIGFALLVRFDDDETDWQSLDPSHVRTELTFRTTRESTLTADDGELLEGVARYQSLGFSVFEQTVEATPVRHNVAEVLGPLNRGISQNGTYSVLWAGWPSTSGMRLLKNATPGAIVPPNEVDGSPSSYFTAAITTEHVTLAFDQTAYEVFAWHSAANVITLKSYVTTLSFAGFAPSLFYNGQVNIQARIDGLTDVVCYYLKKGSSGLWARFQRDNFATEYLLGGYPTRPFYLLNHTVDGLVHSMIAIDEGYRKMRLDATYPAQPAPLPDPYVMLYFGDAVGVTPSIPDMQDEYAIIAAAISEAVGSTPSLAEILDEYTAPPPTNFAETPASSASIANIAYELVIFGPAMQSEAAGSLASIADIAYVFIVPPTTPQLEAAGSTPSISDIYYGP